jgi:uncharacterized protein YigE (DUF2233 family)
VIRPRNILIILLGALFFSFFPGPRAEIKEPKAGWTALSPGLWWQRWEIREGNGSPNTLVLFRIDPSLWAMKVFFDPTPKTITEWQEATRATLVVNGGFYQENFQPAGRIIADGTYYGPAKNRHMKGMFLAEPRKGFEHLPPAVLIDLKEEGAEEKMKAYNQGLQSFPILLDPQGLVRVNPSTFQANRTAVAEDLEGKIYFLITERPFFTLYDFGNYLKQLPVKWRMALNLDGGSRTQLAVRIYRFRYTFSGQGEGKEVSRFFSSSPVKLPSVIGVFPKGGS